MKILVVDDSSTMRKIIKKTILLAGADEVVEAEDGLDALKKLKEHDLGFDMIMLDINMPKVDGVTTLKQLKGMENTKHIPVVMCTSEAEKEMVLECIKAGAMDYVVKPFTKELIAQKIAKVSK